MSELTGKYQKGKRIARPAAETDGRLRNVRKKRNPGEVSRALSVFSVRSV